MYPQFLQPVTDTGWSQLAQQSTCCLEQEPDLENVVSSTPVWPPGTLFLPTFMTLLIPVHSENDSRVYFLIVLTTDYCWRSWTLRYPVPFGSVLCRVVQLLSPSSALIYKSSAHSPCGRPTLLFPSRDQQFDLSTVTHSINISKQLHFPTYYFCEPLSVCQSS